MIEFKCKKCGHTIKIADKYAGKKGKCPKCKSPIEIPQPKKQKEEEQASSLISVFCGKCKHKQKIPKKLLHKAFICENCEHSTLPYTEEQEIPSKEKFMSYTNGIAKAEYPESLNNDSNRSNVKRYQRYNKYDFEESSFIDSVLFSAFWLARLFSGIVLLICFIGIIGGILVYCNSNESIPESPTFYDYSHKDGSYSESIMEAKNEYSNNINKDVCKSQLEDICKRYSLDKDVVLEATNNIYSYYDKMRSIPFMKSFLEGLDRFMKKAEKHHTDPKPAPIEIFTNYAEMYELKVANKTAKTKFRSKTALVTIGVLFVCFIQFICLPLLIQIERNTRDL